MSRRDVDDVKLSLATVTVGCSASSLFLGGLSLIGSDMGDESFGAMHPFHKQVRLCMGPRAGREPRSA